MKILTKRTILALLFCFALIGGAFMLFSNSSITAFAYEQNEIYEYDISERGLECYSGYGCKNGVDLQVNLSGQIENNMIEFADGFGCGSSCGASREDGYSSSYKKGCRNWQVMPIISPIFKYYIDISTLSSLTQTQRARFVADIDAAAAEWNSVRINSGKIVTLQKMSSDWSDVVAIKYDPNLSDVGKFNPVPFFHWIKIKYVDNSTYSTILHEFGHMIGLQDLDMGKDSADYSHNSLMGYASDDTLHYQDIQGLAVANKKHTNHDFSKYWYDGILYNYVCFYCDITNSLITTAFAGGTHLENAATCLHTYQRLVSAGSRHWQKCTKCYKVIESEFSVNVKGSNSIEITGLIDNGQTITIPTEIGGKTVTHIGSNAFLNNRNITMINFANNNVTIGTSAFSGLTNLTQVYFGTGPTLQTIGTSAFSDCSQLSQITIPASVTHIEDSAFSGCKNLTKLTFADGSKLEFIGNSAFEGCIKLGSEGYQMSLPYRTDTAIKIGKFAFKNCTSLSIVEIGFGVDYIGTGAFNGCSNLTKIVIPNTVKSIGSGAFAYCSRLSNIKIPKDVQSIGEGAFSNCTSLTDITLPTNQHYSEVGTDLFFRCSKLKNVNLSNNIVRIKTGAFVSCFALESISLPSSVRFIDAAAFQHCNILKYININRPSSQGVITLDVFAFDDCPLEYICVPDLKSIEDYQAATNWSKYSDNFITTINGQIIQNYAVIRFMPSENFDGHVEIPDGVTKIADSAFEYSNLKSIIIPNHVTSIGDYAFFGCDNLESIIFEENSRLTSIGSYAFSGCKKLESIIIPRSVTNIGNAILSDCSGLTSISVESNSSAYKSDNNCLIQIENNLLIAGCTNSSIPDYVTGIDQFAFWGSGIISITIPDNVENIGCNAFGNCKMLTEINFNITVLPDLTYEVFYCEKLDNAGAVVNIGANVLRIPAGLFDNANNITVVNFADGSICDSIGSFAFKDCTALTEIVMPNSVNLIEQYAFVGCSSLITLVISEGVITIEDCAFAGCTSLKEIIIPASVYNIGECLFFNCIKLENVIFESESGLPSIERFMFGECHSLKTITIPDNVTEIKEGAFYNCKALTNVYFGSDSELESIGNLAFYFCKSLKNIDIIASTPITSIGISAFRDCINLMDITLPDSLISIGDNAFYNCRSLTNIDIPCIVDYIGNQAFAYCSSKLENITSSNDTFISDGNCLINIDDNTLILGCKNSVIPNYVNSIGDYAFAGCNGLMSIVISSNIEKIGLKAFTDCLNLTIYTESSSQLTEWSANWNPLNRPVFLGCILSEDKTYVVSFEKNPNSIFNIPEKPPFPITSAPYRKGYVFDGWYENKDFTGTSLDVLIFSNQNGIYYVKWVKLNAVTFDLNGGNDCFSALKIRSDETVSKPNTEPEKENCIFKFWALSTALSQEYNWEALVIEDITLVAIWENIE